MQKITSIAYKTTTKISAFKATRIFYLTQQGQTQNIDEYYSRFDNEKDLVNLFNDYIIAVLELLKTKRVIDASTAKDIALKKNKLQWHSS